MCKELKNLSKVFTALAMVTLFFTIIRTYFYFIHPELFSGVLNLLPALLYGVFYDTVFVLIINGLVFFLFFFPFRIRNTLFWQGITKIVFVIINFSALLFYLITAKFYDSLDNLFIKISGHNSFFQTLNAQLIKIDFNFSNSWDLLFIAAFIFIVLWNIFPSINNMLFERSRANRLIRGALSFLGIVLLSSALYLHTYKPENWQTKLFNKLNRTEQLLSINSSYKILHFYLLENEEIPKTENYTQLDNLFSSRKKYLENKRKKQSLILVNINDALFSFPEFKQILEASGMSYRLKENFYATHKLEGLQEDELLLSFPAFIHKPLMQTKFAFNQYQSFADVLRKNNYKSFWLSTKSNAKAAKNFYGFDVLIADEDLSKSLAKLSGILHTIEQNYFIFINLQGDFRELMNFLSDEYFNNNTMIIINSKTTQKNDFAYGKTAFLLPENTSKLSFAYDTISDLDIFPSMIDYLGIKIEITAFGKSIFKKQEENLFQYTGNDFIILNDSMLLRYNGVSTKWMINYRKDPDEFYDLQDIYPVQKINLENKIRAVIREYNRKLEQQQ